MIFQNYIKIIRDSKQFFEGIYEQFIKDLPKTEYNCLNNSQNIKKINETIYIVFECLIKIILNKIETFEDKNDGEKLNKMIEFLNDISNNILQLNYEFILYLREIYTLLCFIKVHEALTKSGKSSLNNIKEYLRNINKQFKCLYEGNEPQSKTLLNKECNFLKTNVNEIYFPDLIIIIFSYRIKQFKSEDYRVQLLEFILNDKRLIKLSQPLLYIFLKRYDLIPLSDDNIEREECINSFLSISKENENQTILNLLNNTKDEILDEILLYLFETKINIYFGNKSSNSIEDLLGNLSLEYFKFK